MKGHGEKLSRKKDQAILALLTHQTIIEAAKAVGIGEVTLWRWMKEENFKRAYHESRKRVVEQTLARLQQASTEAVTTLQEVMKDSTSPASSRVTAAKTILELTVKVAELDALEARVQALETKLLNNKGGR